MDIDKKELRKIAEAAITGPWAWRGYTDGSIELRTMHSGQQRVITTMRAEPCIITDDAESIGLAYNACGSCRRYFAAWTRHDDIGDRTEPCEKRENLNTVWLLDHDRHVVRPANDWAVPEVDYRTDVLYIDHPDAVYIAAVTPDVVLGLLDEIEHLNFLLATSTPVPVED
jgi:hypothetical protein